MGALTVTQTKPALVRALFGQMCAAVAHAAGALKGAVSCPNDVGTSYTGTFYDGSEKLATFVYGASGCQTVSLTAGGKTQSTVVDGAVAAAAPRLVTAMAAVLGEPASMVGQPQAHVNQGSGPSK